MKDSPCEDRNVERLVFNHRERVRKGVLKYGVTTDRTDLTLLDWVRHAKEEQMDAAVYLQRIERMLEDQVFDHADLNYLVEACMEHRQHVMERDPDCVCLSIQVDSVERLVADHIALRVKHEEALRLLRMTTNELEQVVEYDSQVRAAVPEEANAFLSRSGLKTHTREVDDAGAGCGCGGRAACGTGSDLDGRGALEGQPPSGEADPTPKDG
jgi:hypothetical protein